MEKKKLDHFWSFRYKHKSSRPFWFWFHLFEYDWSDRNLIRDLRCFFSTAALIHIHHLTPSYWDIGCRVFIACVLVDVVRPRCNKNRQCAWLISCRRSLALATCWLSVHLNDKKAVFFFVFLSCSQAELLVSGWRVGESSEKWREATYRASLKNINLLMEASRIKTAACSSCHHSSGIIRG